MNLRGFQINADRDFAQHKGPYTGYGPGAADLPNWFLNGQGYVGAPSNAATASVSAGLGQANTVGRLSVPANWTVAAPEIRPAAYTLPITAAAAAPEMVVQETCSATWASPVRPAAPSVAPPVWDAAINAQG